MPWRRPARWVAHEWPRITRAAAESAWIVFFDESAVSLIPADLVARGHADGKKGDARESSSRSLSA
jgi:hypothetical protein